MERTLSVVMELLLVLVVHMVNFQQLDLHQPMIVIMVILNIYVHYFSTYNKIHCTEKAYYLLDCGKSQCRQKIILHKKSKHIFPKIIR